MAARETMLGVLNVGVTRYPRPLSAKDRGKFERLARIADFHVLGLSTRLRGERFSEGASFRLVPLVPGAALRLLLVVTGALVLGMKLGLRGRVQVVVCESPYEGIAGVALRGVLRLLGRRVVVVTELHGDWEASPFLYRKVWLRFMVEPILKLWARFVLTRSDHVRAVSQFLKAKAEAQGASVDAVFPTHTDFDLFRQERANVPADPPVVLYVGGLYPIKGLDVLADAFGLLEREGVSCRLSIVGEGPSRESLERKLAPFAAANGVGFRGALAQADVRDEMASASLLVLPSLSEGLPRVIVEAMASALPVVASRVGGIPELVEDGVTGFLVPAGDARSLADRIRELLEDRELARTMGQRGRERALSEFSSQRYFEGYENLLRMAREQLNGTRS